MRIFEHTSEFQQIALSIEARHGLSLHLDDMPQFRESTEHRYHECLAVVPALFHPPRSVFIGGGGDGLAATRLLRLPGVGRVVVCDYDPAVTDLARDGLLRNLNDGSLSDERVEVCNTDAYAWLREHDERFDLVLCDFPDPYFSELAPIYSLDFYRCVQSRLTEHGQVVVQSLAVPSVTRIIRATLRAVFPHEAYYRPYQGGGFTIAGPRPFVQRAPMPDWTRFLAPDMVDGLFILPRDMREELDPRDTPVNDADGMRIVRAALADAIGPQLSSPHPYRPDATDLYLTAEATDQYAPSQIRPLIEGLHERGELVVVLTRGQIETYDPLLRDLGYTPAAKVYEHYKAVYSEPGKANLWHRWELLNDGSVTHLEARTCRPCDDDEVGPLLHDYVERYGDRFFDAPGSQLDLTDWGHFVLCRDPEGRPVTLFKLVEGFDRGHTTTEFEIIYGVGRPRQTLMSLILTINYTVRRGARAYEAFIPEGLFGRSLRRLGAAKIDTLVPYARPATP